MIFAAWSQECLATLHIKPSTRAAYESLLRTLLLPEFGTCELDGIGTMQIQRWVVTNSKRVSPSRTRQAYHLLRSMMGMAVSYGELAKTPCENIRLPKMTRHEKTFLTPVQVAALAEAAGHYRVFVLFLAYTGMRWSEAIALRTCDFDGSRVVINRALVEVNGHKIEGTPKNHHKRAVVIPSSLLPLLRPLLEAAEQNTDKLVFVTKRGKPMRIGNFRTQYWQPALTKAGLPNSLTIHGLRHTCAAMLVKQNVPPKAIQRILGHSSITVTLDIYGHLYESALDDAASALNDLWAS